MANMTARRVLFFGYVWPDRSVSAAGVRTWNLIRALQSNRQYDVHFACAARHTSTVSDLNDAGVTVHHITPNSSTEINSVLDTVQPDISIFDRFVTEEMFGHCVQSRLPDCLRIVDTQDLHCLRAGRADLVNSGGSMQQALDHVPHVNCARTLRELSSIVRSDLSLFCSTHEMQLVTKMAVLPPYKLALASFFYDTSRLNPYSEHLSWNDRRHFMALGSFRHNGNKDALQWLSHDIWPRIRARMPQVECHVYGALPSKDDMELTNKPQGFIVHGPVKNLNKILNRYRVMLAPLRIGAGIKGKICEAWFHGMPVCTTPIGAEGMCHESRMQDWGGLCSAHDGKEFAAQAVTIYENQDVWQQCRQRGRELLEQRFSKSSNDSKFLQTIEDALVHKEQRRSTDYFQAILWSNTMRSTDYMSKWIECKSKLGAFQKELSNT